MISPVMPDHVSGVLASSLHCFVTDPRPPSSSSALWSLCLAFRLDSPFSPVSGGSSLAILLLSVAKVTLLPPQLPPPCHPAPLLHWFFSDLSLTPQASTFYSTLTIFPASFISSMDSLQRSKSSLTQLLREFPSNSATSALPLLRSADTQPAPWPLPLIFTLTTLVLVRL
ncbi:hypothetical protein AMECASPLE_036486 [Ameca splendens]|uniref:Uncharacterized protein n=1 Tax=Ameca splendens TaxID=208324 RepID=A0ABV0ZI98_9TELE